jgi:DNA-binding transcriptional MerR regulator
MVKRSTRDPLATPQFFVPQFGTGQVAKILDMKLWRVQKFVDARTFGLSPSGQTGTGYGSRRLFSDCDLCRIALARRMTDDGFTPKTVTEVLQSIENRDLLGIDERGRSVALGVMLRRSESGPTAELFDLSKPPKLSIGGDTYYTIDLQELKRDVDEGIGRFLPSKDRQVNPIERKRT